MKAGIDEWALGYQAAKVATAEEMEILKDDRRVAHDHLAEIHNRYKSLMTAKINEKTEAILKRLK